MNKQNIRFAFFWPMSEIPYYFELSLHTLVAGSYNCVDIHILIPEIPPKYINHTYPTVFFHQITSTNWKQRFKKKLKYHLNYNISQYHKKVADFKPMLGKLFYDFIPEQKYAWWVYGDMDGLFGNFHNYFNITQFSKYDIISGYSYTSSDYDILGIPNYYSAGPLTFIRNNYKMRSMFKQSINWKSMANDSERIYAFDERDYSDMPGEVTFQEVR